MDASLAFSPISIVSAAARRHANPNRLSTDSRDSDRDRVVETRFRVVIQKNIFAPIFVDSGATRPSRGALACGADRVASRSRRAGRACGKSAFHKGFLHLGKIHDEIRRCAK
jgi:hypothetical protein